MSDTKETAKKDISRPVVEWKSKAQRRTVIRHCEQTGHTLGWFAREAMVEKVERESVK